MRYAMTRVVASIAAVVAAAGLLALPSAAADFSLNCSSQTQLMPDGRIVEGRLGTNPGEHIVWFRLATNAGATYAFEAFAPVLGGAALPTVTVFNQGDFMPFPICTGTSTVTVRDITNVDPRTLNNAKRLSFAGTGQPLFIRVDGFIGEVLSVQLSESGLFSPLWSTFGGFETFYRFQNTTNSSCSVTLRMVNDAGTQLVNTTFPVPANSTVPTVFTGPAPGLNLADNQAGQAIITHDCPPGAIQVDGFTGRFDLATPVVLPVKIVAARAMR